MGEPLCLRVHKYVHYKYMNVCKARHVCQTQYVNSSITIYRKSHKSTNTDRHDCRRTYHYYWADKMKWRISDCEFTHIKKYLHWVKQQIVYTCRHSMCQMDVWFWRYRKTFTYKIVFRYVWLYLVPLTPSSLLWHSNLSTSVGMGTKLWRCSPLNNSGYCCQTFATTQFLSVN